MSQTAVDPMEQPANMSDVVTSFDVAPAMSGPTGSSLEFALLDLVRSCANEAPASSFDTWLEQFLATVASSCGARAAIVLERDADISKWQTVGIFPEANSPGPGLLTQFEFLYRSLDTSPGELLTIDLPESRVALAALIEVGGVERALIVLFDGDAEAERVTPSIRLASVVLAERTAALQLDLVEEETAFLASLHEALASAEAAADPRDATQRLVDALQRLLGCDQLGIAVVNAEEMAHLKALSGVPVGEVSAAIRHAYESAATEALLRDSPAMWTCDEPGHFGGLLTHRRLCDVVESAFAVSSVLRCPDGSVMGAWVGTGRRAEAAADVLRRMEVAGVRVGAYLKMATYQHQTTLGRWWSRLRVASRWHKAAVLCLLVVAAVAAMIPIRHRVRCRCVVEPSRRRFVAAPYDGILERAYVSPGVRVDKGDLLARMDGRQIRWELAGLQAEEERAAKQRDLAVANRRYAEAQVARLEIARIRARRQVLEDRVQQLDIVSPVAGIVTVGDLDTAQGAPVERGQQLFEVAPLTEMMVEIEIPEKDVRFVHAGQDVVAKVAAAPHVAIRGTVLRVRPQSENRQQSNVFIAQMRIANPTGDLRPGMQGRATVYSQRRPIIWIMLHRPWDALRMKLGW